MGILRIIYFFFASVTLSAVLISALLIFSQKILLDREARRPFECGFSTKDESRAPFSLRFFLVAIIFLIFDVELLLLFPFLSGASISNSVVIMLIFFSFLFFSLRWVIL